MTPVALISSFKAFHNRTGDQLSSSHNTSMDLHSIGDLDMSKSRFMTKKTGKLTFSAKKVTVITFFVQIWLL